MGTLASPRPTDPPTYTSTIDCLRWILRHEGVGALYAGLAPCVVRAFPVNAVVFGAYEWTRAQLDEMSAPGGP